MKLQIEIEEKTLKQLVIDHLTTATPIEEDTDE